MSSSLSSSSRIVLLLIGIVCIGVSYGAINYSECFPNGCSLLQSETNGWSTPVSNTEKEIMTPLGCQKVTAGTTSQRYFIPTRTMTEWNRFQTYHPASITIGACAVNGVCGGTSNSCSAGSPSGYTPGVCGGFQTWNCLGLNGGSNASCSIANGACPINGVCGAMKNTCNAGTYVSLPDSTTQYLWQCNGSNGGSNSPICSAPLDIVSCSFHIEQFYVCDICGGAQPFGGAPGTPCLKAWGPLGYQEWVAYSPSIPDRNTLDAQCQCTPGCIETTRSESGLNIVNGSCVLGVPGIRDWTTTVTCSCP